MFSIIPAIMGQEQKVQKESDLQEAIYAGSTKMSQVISYQWDENSIDTTNVSTSGALVLDTKGDNNFNRITPSNTRKGHFQESGRRKFFSNETNASTLGKEGNITNDIDDLISSASTLIQAENNAYGYKNDYKVVVDVNYTHDTLTTGNYDDQNISFSFDGANSLHSTNIKHVTITAQSKDGNTLFQLHTFSANIGENTIVSRSFQ